MLLVSAEPASRAGHVADGAVGSSAIEADTAFREIGEARPHDMGAGVLRPVPVMATMGCFGSPSARLTRAMLRIAVAASGGTSARYATSKASTSGWKCAVTWTPW